MLHEICHLISENPSGSFVVIMTLLIGTFLLIKSFIERNKPVLECECECCEDEDEEEEVVAMGGEEEDNDPR